MWRQNLISFFPWRSPNLALGAPRYKLTLDDIKCGPSARIELILNLIALHLVVLMNGQRESSLKNI